MLCKRVGAKLCFMLVVNICAAQLSLWWLDVILCLSSKIHLSPKSVLNPAAQSHLFFCHQSVTDSLSLLF